MKQSDTHPTAVHYLASLFGQAMVSTALTERLDALFLGRVPQLYWENIGGVSSKVLAIATAFQRWCQQPGQQLPMVVVCHDLQTVLRYADELSMLLPEGSIERLPADEVSPYDLSSLPVQSRMAWYRLAKRCQEANQHSSQNSPQPFILLVSPKNLLLKHQRPNFITEKSMLLAAKQRLAPHALAEALLGLGYLSVGTVLEPGEFCSRGDIIDVYPLNSEPVRLDFFGNDIETIRVFDVDSQRSVRVIEQVTLLPALDLPLGGQHTEALLEALDQRFSALRADTPPAVQEVLSTTLEQQRQALQQTFVPDGIEYYAPLLCKTPEQSYGTILDCMPPGALICIDDWAYLHNQLQGLGGRLNHQYTEGVAHGRLLDIGFSYHQSCEAALAQLLGNEHWPLLYLDTLAFGDSTLSLKAPTQMLSNTQQAPPLFRANMPVLAQQLSAWRREGAQVFISTDYPQRVLDTCLEADVPAVYWSDSFVSSETLAASREIIISRQGLHDGMQFPDLGLIYLTDTQLFGQRSKRRSVSSQASGKRSDTEALNSTQDLREGDYVVHAKHGIGRFVGLNTLEQREYLTVEYMGGDRLYVPVDQVNLLSRYRGAGEAAPKLNRMGGIEWSKVKGKVKKSIQSIARELTELYAKRAKAKGVVFDPDGPWQVELEESFPYVETPDQWQAIQDVKQDMESEKPMDRLVCGDVGFGKTEVALRGIFKAVLSGKQAAVLVPTTILAQQHFNTLSERYQPYGVKVGLLSRFRSAKEQQEVVKRIQANECDVVVGTHRLLQKDIQFSNLGLLVIDEEHRFGVAHKEKIKQFRSNVDVLTLSATPIPRTLYMSLSGIREMSLISTPPTNRLPVKTFVGPYNPAQVRMAILQELDRGGQVYFVHNRVQSIHNIARHLEELLQDVEPKIRIGIGHGQLPEHELENVMLNFSQGEYDILLCTTIVESGLDIPNANTMIIDRSDHFGLAQLYQLRGRVGRSNIQAYAYCYYDPERILTEEAQNRLRAIREFNTLGSGYQIALRDLEIRGVGNVLGSEQHGHMIAVGFDLYCQLLEEAIQEIQEGPEAVAEAEPSVIDISLSAFIPDAYVGGSKNVKMLEYKRLAGVTTDRALNLILGEWRDRFGEVPPETLNLADLVRLRILATDLNMPLIRSDEDALRISVPFGLQEWMAMQRQLKFPETPESAEHQTLLQKLRWVPGVSSQSSTGPTLQLKLNRLSAKEQASFLLVLLQALQSLRQAMLAQV